MGVWARFGMDRQDVGAGLREGGQHGIDRRDHEVDVERQLGVRPQGPNHVRTDGQIGDEMPVHHVDVDEIGPGGFQRADLLAQDGEIAGENRGGNPNRLLHGVPR